MKHLNTILNTIENAYNRHEDINEYVVLLDTNDNIITSKFPKPKLLLYLYSKITTNGYNRIRRRMILDLMNWSIDKKASPYCVPSKACAVAHTGEYEKIPSLIVMYLDDKGNSMIATADIVDGKLKQWHYGDYPVRQNYPELTIT